MRLVPEGTLGAWCVLLCLIPVIDIDRACLEGLGTIRTNARKDTIVLHLLYPSTDTRLSNHVTLTSVQEDPTLLPSQLLRTSLGSLLLLPKVIFRRQTQSRVLRGQ